ncbi:MAG: AAC(3) family N-acetyltransferase [Bacillota bacterium]|nr:AAC(3) family N-acetyltransferase [Bacillota bacterium]
METDRNGLITQIEIEQGLRRLGLSERMCVEVHSSLSSFGHVQGGADAIINALMNVIGSEGAIIMSAYTVSKVLPLTDEDKANGLRCKVKVYPEGSDLASGMGIVADTFRRRADVAVGRGTLRVAAWGKDAALYTTQGYNYLYDTNGYALLLGVDINRMSSMHLAEKNLPDALYARFKPPSEIRRLYPEDQWYVETEFNREAGWNKIQEEAMNAGLIQVQTIGCARCLFMRLRDVIDLYREALLIDAYLLFGFEA